VPQPFGLDDQGRELLSFIPGTVANYPLPSWVWSDAILEEASTLLRRMHDATQDVRFDGGVWQSAIHEPQQVICHNDFAPYNMVFDQGHLVGVIDFDTASPGPRVWDLAYLAYRLVPFVEDSGDDAPVSEVRMARLVAAIRAYGMDFELEEVLKVMALRLEDLAIYTDGRTSTTGDSTFTEHAAMYRRDAMRISKLILK
jgi:Ser/Thr protein kinase RdoA (MazF antagonist)